METEKEKIIEPVLPDSTYAKIRDDGTLEIASESSFEDNPWILKDLNRLKELGYKLVVRDEKKQSEVYTNVITHFKDIGETIRVSYGIVRYPIDRVRGDRHSILKDKRNRLETAPLSFREHIIDVDQLSVQRLTVASKGMEDSSKSIFWTVHEDGKQPIQLFANDFKEIFRLLEKRGTEIHTRYRRLKELIYTSQDWDEVASISWDTLLGTTGV